MLQLFHLSFCLFDHACNITDISVSLNTHFSDKSCSEFYINNGIFHLEDNKATNMFNDMMSIKIFGKENSTIHCHYNAGLAFRNVSNIEFQNVTFHNCGMKFNSTSVNPDSPNNTTLISKAALLFEYCHNLSLSFVTIENSSGVGIQIYNTIGDVSISHCNFVGNKILSNETGNFSGGGGIYIEFSLCQPGTNAIDCKNIEPKFTTKATYTIEYSNFTQNLGSTTDPKRTAFIRAGKYTHFAFGRGGGLSIYFKGNASYNNFGIIRCLFTNNSAIYGAGMFIELQDTSNRNNLTVTNCYFGLNEIISERLGYTGTSGGGAMLSFIIFNSNTTILHNSATFVDTVFESNFAFTGGGFSFHSGRETGVLYPTNHLSFTGCHWYDNQARLGAAIDLSTLHSTENGQLVNPLFRDCTFEGNLVSGFAISSKYAKYGVIDAGSNNISGGYWPGMGIMYLDGITVDLSQQIKFYNNTGSAIAAFRAGINLYSHATVNFTSNQGSEGGALYLSGYSWIRASPNVQVLFINNSATSLGGAIYAHKSGENDLISTAKCFIRYTDGIKPPDQWENVSFRFIDNCASADNGGDAIYTTTVVDCAWDGSFNVVDNSTLRNVFLNWTNFEFITANACSKFIQTSARSFKSCSTTDNLKVSPGEIFSFPFEAQNDFGDTTPTIFGIFSDNQEVEIPNPVVQSNGSSLFIANKTIGNFYLQFVTVDSRKHVGYVDVSVEDCPLGFYLKNGKCVCIPERYLGLSHCSSSELVVYMQPGYWAGKIDNFFTTTECPTSFCKESSVTLYNDSNALCQNRVGTLCGDCAPGFGLSASGNNCVKCKGSHYTAWIIHITTTYIPITIVFVLLLVLNMNLAVGPIHSFLVFSQIYSANYYHHNDVIQIISMIYGVIINVMSLKFDLPFFTNYCLSPKMTVMDYYLLRYLAALYPLLIMVIIISVIRYCPGCIPIKYFWHSIRRCVMAIRRRTSMQQTVVHGFIAFLLLTYADFVNISISILGYAVFEDKTGNHQSVYVPFKHGTVVYFGRKHFPYAITALAFLLIFGILPPLILIGYPVVLSTIGYFGWDDTTTVHTLRRWIPLYKLKPVFDAFWSELKPNCKVFAGFYCVYRFLAKIVWPIVVFDYQAYFALSVLGVIMLFLHALIQPYKKKIYNRADIVMFSIIALINCFYGYSEFVESQKVSENQILLWIQTILPWIPLLFIISYVVFRIRRAHKRQHSTMTFDSYTDDNHFIEQMDGPSYGALFSRIDDDVDDDQDDSDE